jgi:hypothetical protein
MEKFKAMTLEELAEWLDENGMFDNSPWSNWFNDSYCAKCETVKCKYKDAEKTLGFTPYLFGSYSGDLDCAYCELEHKCRFFPGLDDIPSNLEIIGMWLVHEALND